MRTYLSSKPDHSPLRLLAPTAKRTRLMNSYRVEYSESPFYDEQQALTISCQTRQEVQLIATSADSIPEVQLVHLKMADDFAINFPGVAMSEIQVILIASVFHISR